MSKLFNIKTLLFLYLAILSLGIFVSSPTQACACGMLVPQNNQDISMKGERGIVIFDTSRQSEQMVIDFQLSGTSNSSALVVPTPVKSDITQVKKAVFDDFARLATPPPPASNSLNSTATTAPSDSVTVLERKVVGSFEIAVLKANSYKDLSAWTKDNGFNLEPEAEGPITVFIKKKFVLNVIKLKKDAVDSDINPLKFTFTNSKFFYPLMEIKDARDSQKDKSLSLFLLTDEKITVPSSVVRNKELTQSTLNNEITHTTEAGFSNLDFNANTYYLTKIVTKNYSANASLVSALGNPSPSDSTPVKKKEVATFPVWGYVAIAVGVLTVLGVIILVLKKRRGQSKLGSINTTQTAETIETTPAQTPLENSGTMGTNVTENPQPETDTPEENNSDNPY